MQSISYNFGIATLGRVVVNGIGILIVGILTRNLGVVGFGHYSAIMAYLFIFSILADMGLHSILVREISKHDDHEESIVRKIFTLRLGLVILAVALADILIWFFPYDPIIKWGVVIVSPFIILLSMVQIMLGVFQKHLRVYWVSIADMVMRITQLGLLLLLLVYDKLTLTSFLVVVLLAEIVHFGLVYIFSRKLVSIKLSIDFEYWKRILKTSLPIAASLVFTILYFRLDTIFLTYLRPPEEVGIYAVGYKILELVIFIPALYIGLVMPFLSKYAMANKKAFVDTLKKAFNVLAILAFPAVVYLFILSGSITRLVGGEAFVLSGGVLQILTVAIFMIFFGNLGGNALIALDLQKKGMWIYLSGAVFNIITNIIFIPEYGYIAAAWTTVITEIIVTIAMFVVILRATRSSLPVATIFKALGAALVMGISIFPFADNLLIATIIALVYFPVLWLFRGFTMLDIRKLLAFRNTR